MYHGGNLTEATRSFGDQPEGWLDLSTGINPTPYPDTSVSYAALSQLPQPSMSQNLERAARTAYAIPEASGVLAGPGTEFLIDILARRSRAKRVAIVTPTYGGHAEAWRRDGAAVISVDSIEEATASGSDVVVVVNPNNPDGRVWKPDALESAADALRARDGILIVDEAFCDVRPDLSLVPKLDRAPALVLRSFGKFYGLAGIRLGFLMGDRQIVSDIAGHMPPWSVSGPALEVGARALADTRWAADAQRMIQTESRRLVVCLEARSLSVIANAGLFVLVAHDKAGALHAALGRAGIWTRIFDYERRWLRVGLPPASGWARLEASLSKAVSSLET